MFTLAVASGKGGTGKTLVSTHLFALAAEKGLRVTLTDCDAEAPDCLLFFKAPQIKSIPVNQLCPRIVSDECDFCGRCFEWCQYHAVFYLPPGGMIHIIPELCHSCGACIDACHTAAVKEDYRETGRVNVHSWNHNTVIIEGRTHAGTMSPVPVIRQAISSADPDTEWHILDAPPGTSCPFIHTVSAADFVILVAEPTPFGLSDLRQSIDTLNEIGKPYGLIINRCDTGTEDMMKYITERKIPLLMRIPYDAGIAANYARGSLSIQSHPAIMNDFRKLISQFVQKWK